MDGKDVVAMARTGIVSYLLLIFYDNLLRSVSQFSGCHSIWSFLCVDIRREFSPHLLTTQYAEHNFPASN